MDAEELDRTVVELAIGAAGVMNDRRAWEIKIAEITPLVATMLRPVDGDDAKTPLVTARKIREATSFRGEFVRFEKDDSKGKDTKRLVVYFKSDTTDSKEVESDGTESLRTEPSWTTAGLVMQRLIERLEPTTPVVVYKHMESFTGTGEGGRSMTKNSRVLVHLEVVGRPRQSQGQPPAAEPDRRPAPEVERPPAPTSGATTPPNSGSYADQIDRRYDALGVPQRLAYSRYFKAKGWMDFMSPSDDERALVMLDVLGKIERGEGLG